MLPAKDKLNLMGLPQGELEARFVEWGEKPFHARQLMRWVYQRGVTDYAEMTDLSKSLRERLIETTVIQLPWIARSVRPVPRASIATSASPKSSARCGMPTRRCRAGTMTTRTSRLRTWSSWAWANRLLTIAMSCLSWSC